MMSRMVVYYPLQAPSPPPPTHGLHVHVHLLYVMHGIPIRFCIPLRKMIPMYITPYYA